MDSLEPIMPFIALTPPSAKVHCRIADQLLRLRVRAREISYVIFEEDGHVCSAHVQSRCRRHNRLRGCSHRLKEANDPVSYNPVSSPLYGLPLDDLDQQTGEGG